MTKGSGEYLHELTKKLYREGLLTTCVSCTHFGFTKDPWCDRWCASPPLETIVLGCAEWTDKLPY